MRWITCNEMPITPKGNTYAAKQVWHDGDYNYFEIEVCQYDLNWRFSDGDILMSIQDSEWSEWFWLDEST